jgi:hypothetical protein
MRKLLLASAATAALSLGATGAQAQPVKPIAEPGTLVVHLNGYLQFSIGGFNSTFNTEKSATGTYKLNDIATVGDFRIYPGFDGETRSGINYGVQAEIRTGYSNAGVGQGGKVTSSSSNTVKTTGGTTTVTTTTTTNSTDGLYVKRAYAYIGTPEAGYVRFGQTDSAFTLLQNGVVEAFGDGGQWTLEGGVRELVPSAASPGGSQFIYADQAAVYSTNKLVYISPVISGFNLAFGYEPNSNGIKEGYSSCTVAGSTCAALSSSPIPGDIGTRRKNTVDAMLQYVIKVNGFAIKASGGMLYGAPIGYNGPAVALGGPLHYGYDSLQVYQGGAQVTYAGFTLGANVKAGQVLDGYGFKPKGARDALAYIVGANYVLGPMVVGASYFNSQSAGTFVPGVSGAGTNNSGTTLVAGTTAHGIAPTLSEYGVAVGANYVLAKPLSLYTQYMYGHRHQPGNLTLNTRGNSQVQIIAAGATIKW